jgi:hypothetical protein
MVNANKPWTLSLSLVVGRQILNQSLTDIEFVMKKHFNRKKVFYKFNDWAYKQVNQGYVAICYNTKKDYLAIIFVIKLVLWDCPMRVITDDFSWSFQKKLT